MKTLIRSAPLAFAFALALALSACSSTPVKTVPKVDKTESYDRVKQKIVSSSTIAPGFTIHVDHPADAKITGDYEVDFYGNIKMPYKVTVSAAGLTPDALASRISSAYRSFYKVSSGVNVEVRKRLYYVEARGEVQKPGRYLVRLDSSLEEVVAEAGGFAGSTQGGQGASAPKPEFLRIERPDFKVENAAPKVSWFQLSDYFNRYDTEPEFLWRGGESLVFQKTAPPEANIRARWQTITVLGEVREPKEHPMLPNADLLTYLSRSGGPTASADLESIEIIRRGSDDVDSVSLSEGRGRTELAGGDIVMVRAIDNRPTTVDRTLNYVQIITGIVTSVATTFLLFIML